MDDIIKRSGESSPPDVQSIACRKCNGINIAPIFLKTYDQEIKIRRIQALLKKEKSKDK